MNRPGQIPFTRHPYTRVNPPPALPARYLRFVHGSFRAGACLALSLFLSACAYHLGPSNGVVPGSRSITVHPFENATLEPRVTENVANALRSQLQQEGTFELATHGEGDVVVTGVVQSITRDEQSFQARDTRTIRDYKLEMTAHVVATERGSGKKVLDREVRGHTTLRVASDLASAERQAMPLAAANLARNITSLLVDGDW